jgi:DNA-directed RNA polymerase subunit RPC12/RpoP
MARTGTKPGKGTYECSTCGAHQELKTAASTLKPCDECGSELFRKAKHAAMA